MKVPSELPILAIIAMLQRFAVAQNINDIFSKTSNMFKQELADAKNPIATGISYIGSSQCENVKKLVGVNYEQVKDGDLFDLDQLTLVYKSPEVQVTYNLSSLTHELPKASGLVNNTIMVLFVHGFTDNPEKNNFKQINKAFQDNGYPCILALDASPLIKAFYLRASTYVRLIGEKLGQALAELIKSGYLLRIHMIGHSLGAHISSFAAKTYQNITGLKVGRVTGLDPAGPCFSEVDPDLRLMKTDAEFVDAIHTDSGVYGISDSVGHRDYYPNGGSLQPNCFLETCSHSRAVTLFAESISNKDGFPACRCNDYDDFKKGKCYDEISLMGLAATPGTEGRFYLQTNLTEPYAMGCAGLKYEDRDGIVKSITNFAGNALKG